MKEKIYEFLRIFTPLILGGITSFFIKNAIDYSSLNKPILSPPGFVFPIAWSILYLLMGIAYFIYRKDYNEKNVKIAYYLQLFLNLSWVFIFFVLKWYLLAIFWIIILLATVFYCLLKFLESKKSCWILIYSLFTVDYFCNLFNYRYLYFKLIRIFIRKQIPNIFFG